MIYETEPEESGSSALATDSRFLTAQAYLKGLHHGDRPSELMPRDAAILSQARRFYASLSADDQLVIDSFSDASAYALMNVKQRNKRFSQLCFLFMQQQRHTILLPPELAEEGRKFNNEPD